MNKYAPWLLFAAVWVMLPLSLVLLARFADWLETTRVGAWVREQGQK